MEKIKKEVLARVAKRVDKWLIEQSHLYRKHFGFDDFFHVAKSTEAESIVTSIRLPNNPDRRLGRGFYTFGSQQESEYKEDKNVCF